MPPEAAGWMSITAALGFDLARDVDEVVITTTGQGQNPQKPPMLIFVRGRFNLDRLAGVGAQSYGGVPLLGGGEGSTGVVALLDATTAIAGDLPLVRAAIDRRGHGGIPAELAARVEAVRNRYDIWGLGDRPAGYVPPASTPKEFENIDRFQFGILFNHGLELNAEIHSTSPQDAEKLMALASFLETMMRARQPQTTGTKLDVHADHGTLRLLLTVPEEELKKAMAAQAAGMKSALAARKPKPNLSRLRRSPGPRPRRLACSIPMAEPASSACPPDGKALRRSVQGAARGVLRCGCRCLGAIAARSPGRMMVMVAAMGRLR